MKTTRGIVFTVLCPVFWLEVAACATFLLTLPLPLLPPPTYSETWEHTEGGRVFVCGKDIVVTWNGWTGTGKMKYGWWCIDWTDQFGRYQGKGEYHLEVFKSYQDGRLYNKLSGNCHLRDWNNPFWDTYVEVKR